MPPKTGPAQYIFGSNGGDGSVGGGSDGGDYHDWII